ncbi:hypothetical protein V5799_033077, partial [Amblyomma americanum]
MTLPQVHKIIGFAPSLLQVVMTGSLDMPVRQAGAIYLKNFVLQFWQEKEPPPQLQLQPQPLPFHVHEQDRAMVRDALVDAMVLAPELIRVQLASCLSCVLKHDFPGRWTGVVDKVSIFLQSPESAGWAGALLALYTLVKNYEYGSPGSVGKEYAEFADFFLKAYTEGILQVVLHVLDQHRQKVYVSPRVLQHALNYLRHS